MKDYPLMLLFQNLQKKQARGRHRYHANLWFMFASLVCGVVNLSAGKLSSPELEAVNEVFADYKGMDQPGASIAIIKDGEVAYSRGIGLANLEYQINNTPETIFHVASVSKQFTSFAILLLEAEGKLNLDDDIREHLDWLPNFGRTITIRHLILHTSGIRDQWNLVRMAGLRMDDVITADYIRRLLRRQQELNFNPGSRWMYCNSGYSLLADIVTSVSGVEFKQFCFERIFKPLGMKHTHIHDDHEAIVPGRAYSYQPSGDGFKKSVLSYANVGATSLFTTAMDMTRWLHNLDTGEIGGLNVRDKMKETGALSNGRKLGYGYGLFHNKYKGVSLIYHGGIDAGYQSYVARAPEHKIGIIILANRRDMNVHALGNEVLEILLKPHLHQKESPPSKPKELSAKDKRIRKAKENKDTFKGVDFTKYLGWYQLEDGTLIETRIRNGKLMETGDGRWWELIPIEADQFINSGTGWRITFTNQTASQFQERVQLHNDGELRVSHLVSEDMVKQIFNPLFGRYYSPELDVTYEINFNEKQLSMGNARLGVFEILQRGKNKNTFRGYHSQFATLEFERNGSGVIKGVRISNSRVKDLWCEKL